MMQPHKCGRCGQDFNASHRIESPNNATLYIVNINTSRICIEIDI